MSITELRPPDDEGVEWYDKPLDEILPPLYMAIANAIRGDGHWHNGATVKKLVTGSNTAIGHAIRDMVAKGWLATNGQETRGRRFYLKADPEPTKGLHPVGAYKATRTKAEAKAKAEAVEAKPVEAPVEVQEAPAPPEPEQPIAVFVVYKDRVEIPHSSMATIVELIEGLQ